MKESKKKIFVSIIECLIILILCLILYINILGWAINGLNKNCPYTNEELLEEEFGDNPYCGDMGIYEMVLKLSIAFIAIPIGLIIRTGLEMKEKMKKSKNENT